jgi:enoyl-CoA hydratase/carnithine racemase
MSEEQPVLCEVRDRVGVVTLNRPDKYNCISSGLLAGLEAAVDALERGGEARAILLHGNGKVFCSGADLDEVLAARQSREDLIVYIETIHRVLRRLESSPLPVVVAVHGLALAGGIEMMLACDVAFGADTAKIGDQHAQYGLVPGGGGSQRLPRVVGLRRALDLFYTNRWLDAGEAERWGLFNYVVPEAELVDRAMDYCRNLATKSPSGLAAMKRLARQGLELSPDAGLAMEEREIVDILLTDDVAEGLDAFQSRRAPNFG